MKNVRPDFSEYLVHFTKDSKPITAAEFDEQEIKEIQKKSASERFLSILDSGKIFSTRMPWTNRNAICFTECTWGGLLYHSRNYSKYGIGFSKAFVFSRGGGPAVYMPPGLMEHQKTHIRGLTGAGSEEVLEPFDSHLYAFMTPFCPVYAPKEYKDSFWKGKKPIDYSHEREWRIPHNLDFDLTDVAFVIVATYKDMAEAPTELKDKIGRENWIIMENYERV